MYCVREDHDNPEPKNVVNEVVAVNLADGSIKFWQLVMISILTLGWLPTGRNWHTSLGIIQTCLGTLLNYELLQSTLHRPTNHVIIKLLQGRTVILP